MYNASEGVTHNNKVVGLKKSGIWSHHWPGCLWKCVIEIQGHKTCGISGQAQAYEVHFDLAKKGGAKVGSIPSLKVNGSINGTFSGWNSMQLKNPILFAHSGRWRSSCAIAT